MKLLKSIFKPSSSRSNIWNLTKTLIHTFFFWSIFLFALPYIIVYLESFLGLHGFSGKVVLGWILFSLFGVLGLSSGITMSWLGKGTPLPMDCPNELVILGPYKYVRNPMAVAGIGQGICVGIILGSFGVILYAIVGAFLWHLFVRPSEENDLETRFGKSFLEYKKKVWCWIPRF